jgi:hypothetical protein
MNEEQVISGAGRVVLTLGYTGGKRGVRMLFMCWVSEGAEIENARS